MLASAAFLAATASAMAAQWPVGSTNWPPEKRAECLFGVSRDLLQLPPEDRAYAVPPQGGAITTWSTLAGGAAGQLLGLKVFRPIGPGTYLVVGEDAPRPLTPNGLNTFPVGIPVQSGDVIGLAVPAGSPVACRFETFYETDRIGSVKGGAAVGATVAPGEPAPRSLLNVSATILPPPVVIAFEKDAGSFKGGSRVLVFGNNFASVQGVSFGSTPAPSFEANSETQITAIAPPGPVASVPITVTTAAGSAVSAQTFAYKGCRVPRLAGSKLKAVRKRVRKADCTVGKVKKLDDATAKTGKVVRQNPKPGKLLAPGTKVNVILDAERQDKMPGNR